MLLIWQNNQQEQEKKTIICQTKYLFSIFFPSSSLFIHFWPDCIDQDDAQSSNYDEHGPNSSSETDGRTDGLDDDIIGSPKDLTIGSPYSTGTNHSQPLSNCSTPAPMSKTPIKSPSIIHSASTTRDNSISPNYMSAGSVSSGGGGISANANNHNHDTPPAMDILPKLRLNAILAADPALKPEAKDIKCIRPSTADKYQNQMSCDEDGTDGNGRRMVAIIDDDDDNGNDDDDIHMDDDESVAILGMASPNGTAQRSSGGLEPTVTTVALDSLPPRIPAFMCTPCNIKFSSLSTLEAHQTYYCSYKYVSLYSVY